MDIRTALDIIEGIQYEQGEGLLETMMYMKDNLQQFDEKQQQAFRITFAGFRELFAR